MQYLGVTSSPREEWRRASASYGRLTAGPDPRINRSRRDYPNQGPPRILRRTLCDLGHVNNKSELGKYKDTSYYKP